MHTFNGYVHTHTYSLAATGGHKHLELGEADEKLDGKIARVGLELGTLGPEPRTQPLYTPHSHHTYIHTQTFPCAWVLKHELNHIHLIAVHTCTHLHTYSQVQICVYACMHMQ